MALTAEWTICVKKYRGFAKRTGAHKNTDYSGSQTWLHTCISSRKFKISSYPQNSPAQTVYQTIKCLFIFAKRGLDLAMCTTGNDEPCLNCS